ncbi:TIGR02444 family protein [Phenylobacterium immobile]|uniref:TIGR02444 family protein n=1 Tax=Phenylobacterium immobile TaxID=21 RepID=UPI000A487CAB
MDRDDSLWIWSLAIYGRPDVADAGLVLQERYDQNLCLLLWAAWSRAAEPEVFTRAAQISAGWEALAVLPLRALRRGLKAEQDGVASAAREAFRATVADVELNAEKVLLDSLEPLAPRGDGDLMAAMSLASMAWRNSAPPEALARLASAIETAAGDIAEAALRDRLSALRRDHAELDTSIEILSRVAIPDMMLIGRLKRKKLALKDAISQLEDELTPDIIA